LFAGGSGPEADDLTSVPAGSGDAATGKHFSGDSLQAALPCGIFTDHKLYGGITWEIGTS